MKKQLLFLAVLLCFAGMTMQAQQRLVLFEEFTSSTCPPCYSMNLWLNPLLQANADKVVVVKYQMNWPGAGDPYYTAEGGTRRSYYNINSVPWPFTNGVYTGNQTAIQNAINTGYSQPAEATITGTFKVNGDNITVDGSVTPLISGSGYKIHIVVNEKLTTENKRTNGETEFHHVMMKMFPNGNGTDVTLTSGTPIPFSYTYDMSTTHVEEIEDMEVVVFIQNTSTKAILNAAYLEDITPPAPASTTAEQIEPDNLGVNITWLPPSEKANPEGYNVYRNGVKLNTSLISTLSYQDEASEFGKTYTYAVGAVFNGEEGYWKKDTVLIQVTLPVPINVTVQQIRGKKMLVSWEMPAGFEHPVKYLVYRNNISQNNGNPTTGTTFENTGLSYREYCFEVEPVLNEITGTRSASACITLINVPTPKNLKAEQVAITSKEVSLSWDASTSNTAGYNIYRDDIQINTELVTSPTYTDAVPEFDVQYTYQVYGVANTGAESENGATQTITLNDEIPVPQNVQAIQGEGLNVSITWDTVTMNIEGHNIYRNDEKINTELVQEAEYTDNVPAEGNYCYKVTVVIDGVESEKSEPACIDIKVGIPEADKDVLFTIYPNPVSGTFNIDTKESITDCQIFNIQGQLIYSAKSDVKEIATDSWTPGVYIIRVTTEKGSAEKRVVKK